MLLPSILPLTSTTFKLPLHRTPPFFPLSPNHLSTSHVCFAYQDHIGEDARWLREEQRWLREEQRWLREESRWNAERQSLLKEIDSLKLRIQELERLNSLQGASVSNIANLLQVIKDGEYGKGIDRIADRTAALPLEVEAAKEREDEVVIKEISNPKEEQTVTKRTALRIGSEGSEVNAMQEALQRLGFYSGEEDIEYSSFSSGTERAVKTWQATIGAPQDGIMTAALLDMLFGNPGAGMVKAQDDTEMDPQKGANGAPVTEVTNISEVQQTIVTDEGVTEVGVSEHRVYLLGENRWEEPSRLSGGKNPITQSKSGKGTTKCLTCRGEGRLLCMECDGTGEPNIEPQFLEWVGEETKCPYCEGLGYTKCDACGGN
ncbi:protein disulfide isomerase pTAC5, chloroplastic [Andrographis paniculata]|uniref:protein disulfide isomerase pTAC5, chloroplastic n=1 Tax=Andrographis paniculata TaxID=175694 RepID=UPI0021E8F123|nr:protein disulfide isomerase pTAC5, chloroplastic [Andrographis paniculata]XP_051128059.1 protein disulfide isomerase pTAC5, chloroplastic [Andrographis paniculata]XP_051128060.1 protein disulfide isomerase pTAC5, chloroplastic [Andrographis paniculata]